EAAEGAREELVPGAEAREHAVDVDPVRGRPRLFGALLRSGGERVLDRQRVAAEEQRAFRELPGEVGLPGVDLSPQLVLERGEPVDPGLDAEAPEAAAVDDERARPLVVAERLEPRLPPASLADRLVPDGGAADLVAVTEDPRRHLDSVADGALHGVAAAVDLRRHALDLHARRRLHRLREQHDLESFDDLESSNRIPCAAVKLPRSSGVFLHPTSLPRGRLDEDAY